MKTILIIDDEQDLLDFLSRVLQRKGAEVLVASTGEEGLAAYKEKKPDLVLLDLRLPEISGIEVLKKIKEINSDACVYMITGEAFPQYQETAGALGAKGYFLKPIDVNEIVKLL